MPGKCVPGVGCFTCPYPDCVSPVRSVTREEMRLMAAGAKGTAGKRLKNMPWMPRAEISVYGWHRIGK